MRQKNKRFEKKRISGGRKDYTIFEEIQIHNGEKRDYRFPIGKGKN